MIASLLRRQRGEQAEQQAQTLLKQAGHRLLHCNWRCKGGELDLVMCAPDSTVVFVEVRSRSGSSHGGALASITASKQRRFLTAAKWYLAAHPQYADAPCRFDVVVQEANGQWHWLQSVIEDNA